MNKSALEVFADFLRYLYQCTISYIQETHANGKLLWDSVKNQTEFILSHPNGWEGAQQAKMRQAAILAGLVPDSPLGMARIRLVTEGEASLHFCISKGVASDAVKVRFIIFSEPVTQLERGLQDGNGIIIVDAGGGTVDLSAYRMVKSPSSFEEIAREECELNFTFLSS